MRPLFFFCFGVSLMAQDPTPGWHRFGERNELANPPEQGQAAPEQMPVGQSPAASELPNDSSNQQPYPGPQQPYPGPQRQYPGQQQTYPGAQQSYPPQASPQSQNQQYPPAQPRYEPQQGPLNFTIAPGTWVTVRVNEPISSERAQSGDAFLGTLAQPIVVNGLVVARRGQTVQGRVTDVLRAGRIKGTSRLGVQITELGLADGQQIPINTQFIERRGDTSVGQDLGAIGITSGIGAAIGAAAGGGWGAGIGALAGAAVGTTGVLSTRGRETVLFPEQVLTFRIESPVHVASQAAGAFQPGSTADYERPTRFAQSAPLARPLYPAYPYYGSPYYGSFGGYFYSGPNFYFGRGYGGGYSRGYLRGYSRGYGRRW